MSRKRIAKGRVATAITADALMGLTCPAAIASNQPVARPSPLHQIHFRYAEPVMQSVGKGHCRANTVGKSSVICRTGDYSYRRRR